MASLLHTLNLFNANNSDGAVKFYEYDTSGNPSETSKIEFKNTGDITLDASGDIIFDADNSNIMFKDAETQFLKFTNSSGDCTITNGAADKDIIFKDAGGSTIFTIDGSSESILMDTNKKIEFRNTNIHVSSDADGYLSAQANTGVNININGTDELAITSTTATFGTNIVIPNAATIGSVGDTDALSISAGGVVNVSATTNSSSVSTGGLTVAGGLGVAKMVTGGSFTDGVGTLTAGSLTGLRALTSNRIMLGTVTDISNTNFQSADKEYSVNIDSSKGILFFDSNGSDGSSGYTQELIKSIYYDASNASNPQNYQVGMRVVENRDLHLYTNTKDTSGGDSSGGDMVFNTNNTLRLKLWADGKAYFNTNLGIGVSDPDTQLEVLSTSTQQKWSYDGSNFATIAVASNGASTIANSGGNFTIDSAGDIILDGAGNDVVMKSGTGSLTFVHSNSGDWSIKNTTSDKDIIFNIKDNNNDTEVMRLVGADSVLRMKDNKKIEFRNTNIHVSSDADGYLSAQANTGVNININGTDELAITSTTATFGTNIVIPNAATIGSVGDTDAISISSGGVVNVSATTDSSSVSTGGLTVAGGLGVAKMVTGGSFTDGVATLTKGSLTGLVYTSSTTLTDGTSVIEGGSITSLKRVEIVSDGQIQFRDTDIHISSNADGTLTAQANQQVNINISGTNELEITSTTAKFGTNIHLSSETNTPIAPSDNNGGILYTKADGKIYWISYDVSETDLTSGGGSGDKIYEGNTEVETVDTGTNGHIIFKTEGNEIMRYTVDGNSLYEKSGTITITSGGGTSDIGTITYQFKTDGDITYTIFDGTNTRNITFDPNEVGGTITNVSKGVDLLNKDYLKNAPADLSKEFYLVTGSNYTEGTINWTNPGSGLQTYTIDDQAINLWNNPENKVALQIKEYLTALREVYSSRITFNSANLDSNANIRLNATKDVYSSNLLIKGNINKILSNTASGSQNSNVITCTNHGLVVGDVVSIPSGSSEVLIVASVTNLNQFTVNKNLSNTISGVSIYKDNDVLNIKNGNNEQKLLLNARGNLILGDYSNNNLIFDSEKFANFTTSYDGSNTLYAVPNTSGITIGEVFTMYLKYTIDSTSGDHAGLIYSDDDYKIGIQLDFTVNRFVPFWDSVSTHNVTFNDYYTAFSSSMPANQNKGSTYEVIVEWDRSTNGQVTITVYFKGESSSYSWTITNSSYSQWVSSGNNSMTLDSGKSLVIGAQQTTPNPSNYFKGSVEKLDIYQRQLSSEEREFLFNKDSDLKLCVLDKSYFSNNVGIGVSDPDSKLEVLSTSTQQKWSYDGSNYATMAVAGTGASTLANSGGNFTIDSAGDIILDGAGNNVTMKSAGSYPLDFVHSNSGDWTIRNIESDKDIIFDVNDGGSNSEVMRIDGSTSNVGIGVSDPDAKLEILSTSTQQKWSYDSDSSVVMSVANTSAYLGYSSTNAFTIDSGQGQGIKSTSNIKFDIDTDGSDNAGDRYISFTTHNDTATLMNIRDTGFVGIRTSDPKGPFHIKQYSDDTGGNLNAESSAAIIIERAASSPNNNRWYIGHNTSNDLQFWYNTSDRAYFQTGVNINDIDFTGQHRCFYNDYSINTLKDMEGLIVSANKNSYTSMSGSITKGLSAISISDSIPDVSLCNKEKDKAVFGVISTTEDPDRREKSFGNLVSVHEKEVGDTRPYINSLGEGAIWVSNKYNINDNLESGDYITTSSIPGYGMKQDDDLLHNYTVAKITMDCNFNPQIVPKKIILKDSNGDNILDSNGYVQFVDHASETELQYKIRYLQSDGTIITESDYNTRLGNGESVYKAAFVGCTYHCG